MRNQVLFSARLSVLFLLSGLTALYAQTPTGQIIGHVTDPNGATVPEADVTLVATDTGFERKTVTSDAGLYTLPLLPVGHYRITIAKAGFRTIGESDITLNVNQTLTLDYTMSLGETSLTVQVSSEAPLLQAESSELGTVIDQQAVVDLPLNGRNFTQILTLTPGATPVQTAQGAGTGTCSLCDVSIPTSQAFRPSVNGAWNRSNLYYLDGIFNTVPLYSGYSILPVVDAIQEFKVQSHNDQAEYGGVLGGVVNIVSKSGANDLHGSLWEFLRNNVFDARNPFSDATVKSPPSFRQNQFGATLGGPVMLPKLYNGRNRTFFDFSWESWRYRRVNSNRYYVPTDAELAGDFSQSIYQHDIYDPASTHPDPANPGQQIRDIFPGRRIPSARIDTMVVKWFEAYLDRPNLSGNPVYNVLNTRGIQDDSDSYQARIDQKIGGNDSLWFRYSRFNNTNTTPDTLKHSTIVQRPRTNLGGGWTKVFSPNLLLDMRGGWLQHPYHYDQIFDAVGPKPAVDAGFLNVNTLGVPGLNLSSPWSSASEYRGREKDDDWQFGTSLSLIKGNHSFRFGYDVFNQKRIAGPGHGASQSFSFNDQQTADLQALGSTGASLASALLGVPSQVSYQSQNFSYAWPTWALWAQDQWKVTKKLTVNLGLRYDKLQPPGSIHGSLFDGFDISDGSWIIGGGTLPPACDTAQKAPCIPGNGSLADVPFGDHIRLAQYKTLRQPQDFNFGPRLGVAYQFLQKTVFRAGYGISYDVYSGFIQDMTNHTGWWPDAQQAQTSLNNPGDPLTLLAAVNGYGAAPLPPPSPWNTSAWMSDPKKKNPLSHEWNVEIQRQLNPAMSLSVGYVGSHAVDLELSGTENVATTPGAGTPAEVNARKPFPWAQTLFYGTSRGVSDYNSLQVEMQSRVIHGFQGLVSYTWSKVIDNGSSGFFGSENGPGGSSSLQDYYHPNASRGVAAYDVTHFLSVAGTYDLPFGPGKSMLNKGLAAALLGSWQINTIAQIRSGQPYNLQVNGDVANIGNTVSWFNYARPNLVGDPHLSKPTVNEAFNTAAFQVPVLSYGNFGKNVLRSEYVPNVDLSLFKRFPIRSERQALEFRAEIFNVLNIMAYGTPGVVLGNPDFGQINSAVNLPRNIQLALKLTF